MNVTEKPLPEAFTGVFQASRRVSDVNKVTNK
jgi:hypothetical protein